MHTLLAVRDAYTLHTYNSQNEIAATGVCEVLVLRTYIICVKGTCKYIQVASHHQAAPD